METQYTEGEMIATLIALSLAFAFVLSVMFR